jgi:hypothetical protein
MFQTINHLHLQCQVAWSSEVSCCWSPWLPPCWFGHEMKRQKWEMSKYPLKIHLKPTNGFPEDVCFISGKITISGSCLLDVRRIMIFVRVCKGSHHSHHPVWLGFGLKSGDSLDVSCHVGVSPFLSRPCWPNSILYIYREIIKIMQKSYRDYAEITKRHI